MATTTAAANAKGSGESANAPATIQSLQHAYKAPATDLAGQALRAYSKMPNDPPRVLLDSGASRQVVRMEADATSGQYNQWLQMAAGKRNGRTAIDEKGIPTLYIPMSRAELGHAQSDDSIFSVWWLVIRGSWWAWTPTQPIVFTCHGRTFHLDVEEVLPTLTKDEFDALLNGTINDTFTTRSHNVAQSLTQCRKSSLTITKETIVRELTNKEFINFFGSKGAIKDDIEDMSSKHNFQFVAVVNVVVLFLPQVLHLVALVVMSHFVRLAHAFLMQIQMFRRLWPLVLVPSYGHHI